MRSLVDLQALATAQGISPAGMSREQLMDALRDKTGTFDPGLQIDPAKAADLKREIDWTADDYGLSKYLTPAYAVEPKLDGARMRLFLGAKSNTMNTGRRSDKTYAYIQRENNFPHIRDAVLEELAGTILDGEVLAPTPTLTTMTGATTKSLLNATVAITNCNPADSIKVQNRYGKARFFVFDILALQGDSTMGLNYTDRRKLLERVVGLLHEICPEIQIVPSFDATKEAIHCCFEQGFEGAMLKSRSGKYRPGKRMKEWLKVKQNSTFDCYIVDSIPGEGKNTGLVGALVCAVKGSLGEDVLVAQPGAFTDAFRAQLTGEPNTLKEEWVGKVIECSAQGVTKNGRVRHPHMVHLRIDKTPEDCGLDQLEALPRV